MIQLPFPELLPPSDWRPPDKFPSIRDAKWISLDVESKDPHLTSRGPGFLRGDAFIAGVAIATDGFSGYYPMRHLQGCNLAPNVVTEWLGDELSHFEGEVYGANLLYDLEGLHFDGVHLSKNAKIRDIQIAEPLIDEETAEGYSLEVLSNKYLGVGKDEALLRDATSLYVKGFKGSKKANKPICFDPKGDLWMMPPEYVGGYAEADVDRPVRIYRKQESIIDSEELRPIFDLECSLTPILLKMRIHGTRVDLEQAEKLRTHLTKLIDQLSIDIKRLVHFDANVDSGKDLQRAYETLNNAMPELNIVSHLRYTAAGNSSFTAEWLMAQQDPLSRLIVKKRKLMTLRDDFVVGDIIKESINGRIHAQFHQLRQDNHGTRSGRFSSTNPNLQQVPNRFDDDLWGAGSLNFPEEIRKLFIADEGKLFFKGDYSQQEPRLLVHFASLCKLAGAELAVEAFRKNPRTDYHQLTTTIVNQISGKAFKRKQIKGINLGVMYSMGIAKLCRMLGVSEQDGREILSAYHVALPFVRGLSTMVMSTAQARGFIKTLLGRRRRFNLWEPIPENEEERKFKQQGLPRQLAEQKWPGRRLQRYGVHKALNALIQGSAADQTKYAMHVLYYEYGLTPQMQVHDELCSSVCGVEEARTIKRVMEDCVKLQIPAVCDGATGPSWGDAKEEVMLLAA